MTSSDLARAAVDLVAEIDRRLDSDGSADLDAAAPLLDRLRSYDPLVLPRAAQGEVLRCWARTVDERIGRADVPAAVVDEDLAMLHALRSAAGRGPGPVPLL
ncbi:hypothetical protein, partial [Mangrovactinospora gilvigrisea]|uniref:hypothetical protein n=1 Tax=Mangrovactinospora gilvigrisea TaxID=1428644 RepID=UPI000A4DB88F